MFNNFGELTSLPGAHPQRGDGAAQVQPDLSGTQGRAANRVDSSGITLNTSRLTAGTLRQ